MWPQEWDNIEETSLWGWPDLDYSSWAGSSLEATDKNAQELKGSELQVSNVSQAIQVADAAHKQYYCCGGVPRDKTNAIHSTIKTGLHYLGCFLWIQACYSSNYNAHSLTLHYITLHYIASHCIASHYIALHHHGILQLARKHIYISQSFCLHWVIGLWVI